MTPISFFFLFSFFGFATPITLIRGGVIPHQCPLGTVARYFTNVDVRLHTLMTHLNGTGTPQASLLPRGRCMELEQGNTLGGSTALNYMVWVRGQRGDFDRWEKEHGCTGWGYDSVVPHFEVVESRLLQGAFELPCNPPTLRCIRVPRSEPSLESADRYLGHYR